MHNVHMNQGGLLGHSIQIGPGTTSNESQRTPGKTGPAPGRTAGKTAGSRLRDVRAAIHADRRSRQSDGAERAPGSSAIWTAPGRERTGLDAP